MPLNAMEDLLLHELTELYGAERQIEKSLPKMAKAAHHQKLRGAFELHLKQTHNQVKRLESIFKMLNLAPEGADCEPVAQIVKQADTLLSLKHTEPEVVDAALISAGQKIEHYEIALYGTARSHAGLLGYQKVAGLLADTLHEEEQTDALLTQLARKSVNPAAAKAPFSDARTAPRGEERSTNWGMGALIGVAIGAAAAMLLLQSEPRQYGAIAPRR
jgi:ferritin-like metal-binding protein YciE